VDLSRATCAFAAGANRSGLRQRRTSGSRPPPIETDRINARVPSTISGRCPADHRCFPSRRTGVPVEAKLHRLRKSRTFYDSLIASDRLGATVTPGPETMRGGPLTECGHHRNPHHVESISSRCWSDRSSRGRCAHPNLSSRTCSTRRGRVTTASGERLGPQGRLVRATLADPQQAPEQG